MKYISILMCFFLGVTACSSQKDSLYKDFNRNGKIVKEGRKVNGLMEGEWKYYDDSLGYLKKIVTYKYGLYHGSYQEFYPNGKSKKIGSYDRNFTKRKIDENGFEITYAIPLGTWDYYNDSGELIKSEVYDCTGKIVKVFPEK